MKIKTSIITFCFLISFYGSAQEVAVQKHLDQYRYDKDVLSTEFTKDRRDALRNLMADNSAAIILANPIQNRSNDVDFQFHQYPNLYYLTGFTESNSALIIFKSPVLYRGSYTDEILLLQNREPSSEIWDGRRLGVENAKDFTGISAAESIRNFNLSEINWSSFDEVLYEAANILLDKNRKVNEDLNDFKVQLNKLLRKRKINATSNKLNNFFSILREVKQLEELTFLQKAIDITCSAQIELMKALKDSMAEYQTEAIVEYIFKDQGAEYPGFPSIQGGGENSCVLHYTSNRKVLHNRHLLVSDIGAEYRGYTADVTRTLPVDGTFSEEEKAIYNLVLKAQNAGIRKSTAGNPFRSTHEATTEIVAEGLLKLGIIKDKKEVRKYFMHGTSHYLGLDVHDLGTYGPLQVGSVITVEPGIYIAEGSDCDPKWWDIGVRIEDDILITEDEPINLSKAAPRTVEEIERMMLLPSKF